MAKASPVEKLNTEITKILAEYSDEINTNMGIVVRSVCGKGAKALRASASQAVKSSDYAKSWKSQVTDGRLYTEGVIYSEVPQLPHLLEYGHVVISGGRVAGRAKAHPHIEPVAKEIVESFEREVMKKL